MAHTCVIWCEQNRLDYMVMPGNITKYNRVFAEDPLLDEEDIFDMLTHFNNAPKCSVYQFASCIPKACGVIVCGITEQPLRKPETMS